MLQLIVTTTQQSIGSAIEDILLVAECALEVEIREQAIVYLPLGRATRPV